MPACRGHWGSGLLPKVSPCPGLSGVVWSPRRMWGSGLKFLLCRVRPVLLSPYSLDPNTLLRPQERKEPLTASPPVDLSWCLGVWPIRAFLAPVQALWVRTGGCEFTSGFLQKSRPCCFSLGIIQTVEDEDLTSCQERCGSEQDKNMQPPRASESQRGFRKRCGWGVVLLGTMDCAV